MSNVMSSISNVFWRIRAAWHNFWVHPAVRWIPATISAVWHWFHGVGSCGGHKRRLIAMFNIYVAVKLRLWRVYKLGEAMNTDRHTDVVTWIAIGIVLVLFLQRIDRKRTCEGDEDYFGYGSLLFSLGMILDCGSWIFESNAWLLPIILPGPMFFDKFNLGTNFINQLFPKLIADVVKIANLH